MSRNGIFGTFVMRSVNIFCISDQRRSKVVVFLHCVGFLCFLNRLMLPPVLVVVEVLPSPHVLKMNFLRKKRKQLYLLLVCYKKQIIDVILLLRFFLQGNPIFRLFINKFGFSFHPLAHKLPPSFCMGCPFFS